MCLKYRLKLMQRVLDNDQIIVYITKKEEEEDDAGVYLYDEFIIYDNDIAHTLRYVRIYLCYDLMMIYKPMLYAAYRDHKIRAKLPENYNVNIQDILIVNDLLSKHTISEQFIKLFEQLVHEYMFEV